MIDHFKIRFKKYELVYSGPSDSIEEIDAKYKEGLFWIRDTDQYISPKGLVCLSPAEFEQMLAACFKKQM